MVPGPIGIKMDKNRVNNITKMESIMASTPNGMKMDRKN